MGFFMFHFNHTTVYLIFLFLYSFDYWVFPEPPLTQHTDVKKCGHCFDGFMEDLSSLLPCGCPVSLWLPSCSHYPMGQVCWALPPMRSYSASVPLHCNIHPFLNIFSSSFLLHSFTVQFKSYFLLEDFSLHFNPRWHFLSLNLYLQ